MDDELKGLRDGRHEAMKMARLYRAVVPRELGIFLNLAEVNAALDYRRLALAATHGPVYASAFVDAYRGGLCDYGAVHTWELLAWRDEQKRAAH